jgi:exodeoxyribonuclease-3
MKIISYNVNGIRAAQRKGFEEWIAENDFDIICLQESKAQPEQVEWEQLAELGYRDYWFSAEKKGYSGVITLSRREPQNITRGIGQELFDYEGRVLRTDFEDFSLLNCYFPSGTTGNVRQDVKMEFLDTIYEHAAQLLKEQKKLIVVGDYNIAHTENDIHDPKRNKKTSGFLPEEREWLTKWWALGFIDAFRHCYPEKTEYSWWSYRAAARSRNKGWRLDYQAVSEALAPRIKDARQLTEVVHSDHCPVILELGD